MKVKKVKDFLNIKYPFRNQEIWDNSKLNSNSFLNQKVTQILISLDINKEVINLAIKSKANVIITHHPLYINKEDSKLLYIKDLKKLLSKNKITHIPLHTNYDLSKNSMSFKLTKIISKNVPKKAFKNSFGWIGDYDSSFLNFKDLIKKNWNIDYLITDKSFNQKIFHFYFSSGAGSAEIEKLLHSNKLIDAYISGEIKWHLWNLARDKNKILIDVGHGIERFFIKDISALFKNWKVPFIENFQGVILKNYF